jgi:RHS repeat-associated protein
MKKKLLKIIIGLYIGSISTVTFAQTTEVLYNRCKAATISGNAVVQVNQKNTYSLDNSCRLLNERERLEVADMEWYISSNGVLNKSYDGAFVSVTFTEPGVYTLYFDLDSRYRYDFSKQITVTTPPTPTPPTPPTPKILDATCSSPTITRFGSPGTDIKWYWQTSASGTSTTLGSETILTIGTSGNYYLRALSTMYGGAAWSTNSSNPVLATVIPCPDFSDENYIHITIPKKGVTSISSLAESEKIESITYFDGLGRPKQNVAIRAGGQRQDIITHISYDDFGRQAKDYLPYAATSNGGLFRTGDIANTTNQFYQTKYPDDFAGESLPNVNAYSQKVFDGSPLNRVLEQAAPGKDWKVGNGHTIQFDYQANAPNEVLNFGVEFIGGNTATPKLKIADSYYNSSELYKTITKDENWRTWDYKDKTTEEFKNKQGQVVLKRTYNNQQAHDTYYVYDDFGNLSYVLPPLASDKTILYETGMQSYPASTFVTGSNAAGTVKFGIEKIAPGQYGYVADFDLHNLANSNFKSGEIMDLPYFYPSMSNFWLGSVSVSNSLNGSWAYKSASFYIRNGKLMCYAYEYNRNNIPLVLKDFDSRRTTNLPQNLQGFTEAATQEKVTELLDKLCYQYKYDHRNRLIEKKIPGKEWEYIVYNKLDQPIITSDYNQYSTGKWLFTKYDVFGRVAFTGVRSGDTNRIALQTEANNTSSQYVTKVTGSPNVSWNTNSGTVLFYNNESYPTFTSGSELYTINYYDTYTDLPTGLGTTITTAYQVTSTTNTKGLPTISKVRVLDTKNWITTVSYYDDKARPIYIYSKNDYLGTTDIIESKLDFTGKVLETKTTHKKTGQTDIVTVDKLDYDHADRLLTQKQTINTQAEELIVKNNYDELGQLVKKEVGNTEASPLQEVDFSYNIRGWLKKINDPKAGLGKDLFAFELLYNDPGGNLNNSKLYNGNISQTIWKTANDNTSRYYNYSYDDLNRITRASYYSWNQYSRFNLGSISYDKNGNLQRLYRRGAIVDQPDVKNSSHYGTMDYLTYAYDGNQLLNVRDTGDKNYGFKDGNIPSSTDDANDYDYDANGNMTIDNNKGISSITYNHLNLPTKVTINEKNIDYIYDATGVKLEKRVNEYSEPSVTQYAGNYIYKKNAGKLAQFELQFFNTSEGYATPNNSGEFDYIYQHKDHLGNVRLSYKENTNTGQETVFTDGFESMANWDKSKKKSGDYSGRIDDNYPANWEKYIYSDTWTAINNSEETFYTVSGWVFVEDIPNNDAQLWLSSRKAGETSYPSGNFSTTSTTRGKWEYLSLTILVPADVRELNIRIDNNKAGKVWFDDIKIVKGNTSQTLIVEESNYYPFGLQHKGYNNVVNGTEHPYTYNGKEEQNELGLNWLDFGARNYDASLGRWMNLDPLSENYSATSPYVYALNNPMFFVDPDGRDVKNADEERKKKAQKKLKTNQNIVASAESKYGTEKGSFKNKAQYKRYKKAKRNVKKSGREVSKYTRRSKITQKRIDAFKKSSPKMFAAMDNMQNQYGETVDVMVGVDNMSGYNGKNEYSFDTNSAGEVRQKTLEFGMNTTNIFLNENSVMGKSYSGTTPTSLEVTKHEMGHANYEIQNAKSFQTYLNNLKKSAKGKEGHNSGNPSGNNATLWQGLKDIK